MRRHFFLIALMWSAAEIAAADGPPTYSKEISRIIQQKCQMCHRPNDIAPFSLMSLEDAQSHGRAIRAALQQGIMPPWKPVKGHGDFQNNLSLSDEQRQTIFDWLDAEMPEGDPADLPAPIVYASEWRLGQPDQVIGMPVAYTPVAREDRPDRYRCFVLPEAVDQDRWVRAVDILPGLRSVVHHVILYMADDPKQIARARELEDQDSDPGYDCWGGPIVTPGAGPGPLKEAGGMLGAWVPGMNPAQLPGEIGVLVPKGVTIVMQVHYNLEAGDPPGPDQTRVGLYYHAEKPANRLFSVPVKNSKFELAPETMDQKVDASFSFNLADYGFPIPDSLAPQFSAIGVGPHMHQLGRKIRADLVQPDGTEVPLIRIDDWDFHWQSFYMYQKPVPMPYRSKVKASCVFDNTTDRIIRWGESTEDEMCLVYVSFIAQGGISILLGNPQ